MILQVLGCLARQEGVPQKNIATHFYSSRVYSLNRKLHYLKNYINENLTRVKITKFCTKEITVQH